MIGVKGWVNGDITNELKKSFLLFDQIAFRHIKYEKSYDLDNIGIEGRKTLDTIDLLSNKGLVIEAPEINLNNEKCWNFIPEDLESIKNEYFSFHKLAKPKSKKGHLMDVLQDLVMEVGSESEIEGLCSSNEWFNAMNKVNTKDIYSRLVAVKIRIEDEIDAIPIIGKFSDISNLHNASRTDVAHMVFSNIPMPTSQTSWEAIFDYKNDVEAKQKYYALKKWINSASNRKLNASELNDEFNELLYTYKHYMNIQHKKLGLGNLETILVSTAEIIENTAKLNISKSIKTIFKLLQSNTYLMEKELTAPGRDLAYIAKTQYQFIKKPWWKVTGDRYNVERIEM